MLFDGAVTLDENGEGTITLDEPMALGNVVVLTYDGQEHEGIVGSSNGDLTLEIRWGNNSSFGIEGDTVWMYDDDNNPVTGDVDVKLVQNGLPELEVLFEGTVALTDDEISGTPVKKGSFEASRELENGEAYFVFIGDDLKAYTSDPGASWAEGTYMYGVSSAGGANWLFITTDTSQTSASVKFAVQDPGK